MIAAPTRSGKQAALASRTAAGQTMLMETLGGFPNLPALWLRRAQPDSANAITSPHHALTE
jgi:hypothetical protein